ncbi:MAG: hypothetical protein EMLJLAPB_00971 [Candidatus Argoarchaeum ethanivorans]|uniref:Uncharacterized protein n=1 Tax=Candidatus Argoarchaeum ethanivorans TaxID=2608793 RepID=A0A811TEE6_9EURY|nr:MAG: hypothetical protein EMLJLAPB_00971 [Candidatus Argoarchaeum ethanivorans]
MFLHNEVVQCLRNQREKIKILERELNLEEYVRFPAVITPKVGDSVKELRGYRDKATYEEILERYTRKKININRQYLQKVKWLLKKENNKVM